MKYKYTWKYFKNKQDKKLYQLLTINKKSMSLKQSLERKLNFEGKLSRKDLRSYGESLGYDVSNVDRQLRKLTEMNKIKPIFNGKYIMSYEVVKDACEPILSLTEHNEVGGSSLFNGVYKKPKLNPYID